MELSSTLFASSLVVYDAGQEISNLFLPVPRYSHISPKLQAAKTKTSLLVVQLASNECETNSLEIKRNWNDLDMAYLRL